MTVKQSNAHTEKGDGTLLPEHLVSLPGGDWMLWRWIGLRGAGFPVEGVLQLASPQCAIRADELSYAEDEAESAWEQAIEALRMEMEAAEHERWVRLSKILKQLKNGKVPNTLDYVLDAKEMILSFAAACERVDQAWGRFSDTFEHTTTQTSQAIRDIVSADSFQEAIVWQNRSAFHTALMPLLEEPPDKNAQRNKDRRRREELMAMYWQRYCTKNDTIGFFGPVGWARIADQKEPISVRAGETLLAVRNLYLDGWCIDALASTLAQAESMRQWIAPRRLPTIHLEGRSLYLPLKGKVEISSAEALLIQACDGHQTAKQIAQSLMPDGAAGFDNQAQVLERLAELHDKGIIAWSLDVPWTLQPPFEWHIEQNLKRQIARIEDPNLYESTMAAYDELIAARDLVAESAGNAQRLDVAMGQLEATFTRMTGTASTRADGKMYAGRTLVYEDCQRAMNITLSPQILEELGQPLSLVLTSARWFISSVADTYMEAFREIYSDLAREMNSTQLDFITFWSRVQPLIFGDKRRLIKACLADLQQRWADILKLSPDQSRASFACEQLRPRVQAEFAAQNAGWNYARYHSPDIMIGATSPDAIRRGDYQLVLGEFHVGTNTLCNTLFMAQHPCPAAVLRDLETDMGRPRIVPVPPKFMISSRDYSIFVSPRDYRLEFARDPSGISDSRALPIGSLVIEKLGDELIVKTRDGKLQFGIIEVFGDALSERVSNSFKMLAPGSHLPRVSFDKLIVSRETWVFSAPELEFAFQDNEAHRFLAARRWARENDLPRFIYFRSPVEVKPCFVDFDSRIYIDIFAKAIRRTMTSGGQEGNSNQAITVAEMLPAPDQTWLPDNLGRHYTSELRVVAIDQAAREI
jgi:hypothetical protein